MSAFTIGGLRTFACLTINCSAGRRPFDNSVLLFCCLSLWFVGMRGGDPLRA